MEKILKSHTRIRFQDCDPFNHLNNSKYIDYFINAREDHLMEYYNLDVYEKAFKEGLGWVVGSNQIAYFNPANTMETVLIESQLIKYSGKSLLVEMRMWDEGKRQLKAAIWTGFVHYNLSKKKAIVHAPEFIELFKEVVLAVEEESFENRRKFLALTSARTRQARTF